MMLRSKPAHLFDHRRQLRSNKDQARGPTAVALRRVSAMVWLLSCILVWCCLTPKSAAFVTSASYASAGNIPYPLLSLVEQTVVTTATLDFGGNEEAFEAATSWNEERLRASEDKRRAPHLACAEYDHGHEAISSLKGFLSPEAVKPVHHSSEHGACFVATASDAQAVELSTGRAGFALVSVGVFPSALKIAPGILEHGNSTSIRASEERNEPSRLTTTHGPSMQMDNVQGLIVELTPGVLPAHSIGAETFVSDLLEDLGSKSANLHSGNFWSDPAMVRGGHLTVPEGAVRGREWSRAATVVHELSAAADTTPGDICSWDGVGMHHAANDVLLVSGMFIQIFYFCSHGFPFKFCQPARVRPCPHVSGMSSYFFLVHKLTLAETARA